MKAFPDLADFAAVKAKYPLKKIGVGARRICFSIGETGYCVKFLRTLEDDPMRPLGWRAKRMLKHDRFNRKRNINCLEAEAMEKYRVLAGPRVAAALPEVVEIVFDEERGWGVLMSELRNADGSGMRSSVFEAFDRRQDAVFVHGTFAAMRALIADLIAVSAPFYEGDNFVTQFAADGSWCLRIIDFEPLGKKFFAPERYLPFYRRWLIRRQSEKVFEKYLLRLAAM